MKRLEKFLIVLAVTGLALFYGENGKKAGVLFVSLALLAVYYLLATPFLFYPLVRKRFPGIAGVIITGIILAYSAASILMYAMHKMTASALLLNNLVFLGMALTGCLITWLRGNKNLSKAMLPRLLAFLLIIVLQYSLS